jgi:hypothetical protein
MDRAAANEEEDGGGGGGERTGGQWISSNSSHWRCREAGGQSAGSFNVEAFGSRRLWEEEEEGDDGESGSASAAAGEGEEVEGCGGSVLTMRMNGLRFSVCAMISCVYEESKWTAARSELSGSSESAAGISRGDE